jgi:hypothetical protein
MWGAARPDSRTSGFLTGVEANAMTGDRAEETTAEGAAPGKTLGPAARRALLEAAGRRPAIDACAAAIARDVEHQGRGGLEPVRYEDWEVKGLATDF